MSIAIRLSPETEKRLTALAKKTHRSKSYFAREAIENYIEDLEDYYLAKAVQANPGKIYTAEEVRKMCDLED
jgi:RHH-type rel operon transcriptional repressor/antitoxin RelB